MIRYLGAADVAAWFGVDARTVTKWRARYPEFPTPDAMTGGRVPGWLPERETQIRQWEAQRPGRGARTDLNHGGTMNIRFQLVTSDPHHERRMRHDIPAETWADAERDAIREHGKHTGVDSDDVTVERLGILDATGHEFHGFHVRSWFSHDDAKWMYKVMFNGESVSAEHDAYAYTGPNEPTAKGFANKGNAALAKSTS